MTYSTKKAMALLLYDPKNNKYSAALIGCNKTLFQISISRNTPAYNAPASERYPACLTTGNATMHAQKLQAYPPATLN